jgi:NTE family protein
MPGTRKVALALGAGGSFGLAHVGVLDVLHREGLVPDLIVGCSIGAVAGALYGSGIRGRDLVRLSLGLRRQYWLDLRPSRMGLVAGQKLTALLRLLTRDRDLDELNPPLAVVATDIERGERVVFTTGRAAERVRASAAIPGIFTPVVLDDRVLVDGAVLERVPVRTARELGATHVIEVSLGLLPPGQRIPVRNLFEVVLQSFDVMEREIYQLQPHRADVTLEPEVLAVSQTDQRWAMEFIRVGREAAERALPAIRMVMGGVQA